MLQRKGYGTFFFLSREVELLVKSPSRNYSWIQSSSILTECTNQGWYIDTKINHFQEVKTEGWLLLLVFLLFRIESVKDSYLKRAKIKKIKIKKKKILKIKILKIYQYSNPLRPCWTKHQSIGKIIWTIDIYVSWECFFFFFRWSWTKYLCKNIWLIYINISS